MTKSQVLKILRAQPEELDVDRLIYTLYVRRKIEQGIADADAGRVVSLEEIDRMIDEWPE